MKVSTLSNLASVIKRVNDQNGMVGIEKEQI